MAESQSPIDIISAESLQATGTPELATALARALPSLNFPRPALSDGTSAIRPAQLRGLSPDQVLVLVNGKRRHTSSLLNLNGTIGRGAAAVDLNTIPVAAIARVEVLRDGASAQYGSDAIAGVVNIVLKGAEKGGSLQAGFGQYSAGDGNNYELSGDTGVAYGGDRGWLHVAAQLNQQDPTDRARAYAGAPSVSQPAVGRKAFKIGDPEVNAQAVSANTEFAFTDSITGYAFATASNRDITSFAFFARRAAPRRTSCRSIRRASCRRSRPTPRIARWWPACAAPPPAVGTGTPATTTATTASISIPAIRSTSAWARPRPPRSTTARWKPRRTSSTWTSSAVSTGAWPIR